MELDKASKALKDGRESELQAAILQHMTENGMQSVNFPGIGRVVKTTRNHYEIIDKEKFVAAMCSSLARAAQEKRPLTEAMLAQFRVSRESLEGFIECSGMTPNDCGVADVARPELSIRKS